MTESDVDTGVLVHTESNPTFWRLWRASLSWAIPVSYLVCGIGFSVALTAGLVGDGYADSTADYVSAVFVGFFIWGTVIFFGTCYILVPFLGVVIAAARLAWRRHRR